MNGNRTSNQATVHAFIVTMDCSSDRYNFTKQNIERALPNFCTFHCVKPVSLNDSHILQSIQLLDQRLASNLITFVTLLSNEIPKYLVNSEFEWAFVFEDDVDFIDPSKFSLPNYINPTKELMYNPEIQFDHGMFYLGICGPQFAKDNRTLNTSFSNNTLLSRRGCGFCVHAVGFTIKRARSLWGEISIYIPAPIGAFDVFLQTYIDRSGRYPFILGANAEWPPGTGHHGVAYQDRARFGSQVWG